MRNLLRHYWPHMRKYKLMMALSFIGHAGSAVFSASVVPLLYKRIIDVTTQTQDPSAVATELFGLGIILTVSLILSYVILRRIGSYAIMTFESNVMRDLANVSFDRLRKYSYTFFSNEFAGALVAKQGRFVNSFESIFDFILFTVILGGLNLIAAIAVLAYIQPTLALIFFVWITLYLALVIALMPPQRTKNLARAAATSKLTALFADIFSNILTVSSFASGTRENARYATQSEETHRLRLDAWYGQNQSFVLQSIMSVVLQGGVMLFAIYLWIHGQITAGTIVLLQIYVVRAADMVWDIGRSSIRFQSAVNDAQEMADLLEQEIDVGDPKTPEMSRIKDGAITFKDVTFAYGEREPIFEHFNLVITPGEKVALVGHSGAGKTTVTKLLLRFLDVTGGSIEIDGQDIRSITQDDLRRAIGYVAQEPMLFHRSLRENIAYGKPDATDGEVEDAARRAHAHEFISALPQGYATLVGERGVKLSGGERQRVAIARAMLKDAPILVLDEATSALDSESESLIQSALAEAMKDRTTIAIAHRLSTIKHMDRILVFDGGKIVEQGTHDELISRSGIYGSLWAQQSGGFIAADEAHS